MACNHAVSYVHPDSGAVVTYRAGSKYDCPSCLRRMVVRLRGQLDERTHTGQWLLGQAAHVRTEAVERYPWLETEGSGLVSMTEGVRQNHR